jgi:sec-independent protein translocase protein TatA
MAVALRWALRPRTMKEPSTWKLDDMTPVTPLLANLGPTEIILIILVLVLLFGAKKLPDLARGSGRALRIFKAETKGLLDDDDDPDAVSDGQKTEAQRQIDAQRRVDAARRVEAERVEGQRVESQHRDPSAEPRRDTEL